MKAVLHRHIATDPMTAKLKYDSTDLAPMRSAWG